MIESLLAVALAIVVSLFVPSLMHASWGLLELQPHPLWLIVLALAIRYGVPSGEISAILAAGGYLLLEWLRPNAQDLGAGAFYAPFMLLLSGIVTAELAQARLQRLATEKLARQELSRKLRELHQRHAALVEVKTELEKRIVGQPASLTMLYQLAKRLDTLDLEQLCPAVLDMVTTFLEAKACAVYTWQEGRLHLCAGLPLSFAARVETLDSSMPVIAETLRTRRVTTIRDVLGRLEPEAPAHGSVLMAGPLLQANGQIYGVVIVERLAFLKLSPATRRLFELILDWGSRSLGRALLLQQSSANQGQTQELALAAGRAISRPPVRSPSSPKRRAGTRASRVWKQQRTATQGTQPRQHSPMATLGPPTPTPTGAKAHPTAV